MVKAPPPPVTERLLEPLFAYPKPEPLPPPTKGFGLLSELPKVKKGE